MADASFADFVESLVLPSSFEEAFAEYIEPETGKIVIQENSMLDFKDEFPSDFSSEYFGGILRLVCAFNNTDGGLIVFGIADKERRAGFNKESINIEHLNNVLRQILSNPVECVYRNYNSVVLGGEVDVLLVPKRPGGTLPTRALKDFGRYRAGDIYIRQGHEVLRAEPRHVPKLYCRTSDDFSSDEKPTVGSLPPSPATVKQFVGRLKSLDALFSWLYTSDEPRTFLYGKGGSGKTTIAYEFARIVRTSAYKLPIYGGATIDQVVFLTAKERELSTVTSEIVDSRIKDFGTEEDLYRSILLLSDWSSEQDILTCSIDILKSELKSLLDNVTSLIVIDDIDTLTTKNMEGGFDFLYRTLCRCKSGSKILYTLRNAPTQSITNSIEVPGLEVGGEYEKFVEVCAQQFKVPSPDVHVRDVVLSAISERRPLIIESIVGLRRHSSNYEQAIAIFRGSGGDDARNYIFRREWNILPQDNRARSLVYTMALLNKPVSLDELRSILAFDETGLRDALSAVSEIFLSVDHSSDKTKFSLGPLTTAFAIEEGRKLDRAAMIVARVDAYRKAFYPRNPRITEWQLKVDRVIAMPDGADRERQLQDLWSNLRDTSIEAKITEDPRFRAILGQVACSFNPPKLHEARENFKYCYSMGYEFDIDIAKLWFHKEYSSGIGLEQCIDICNEVIASKVYTSIDKAEFWTRKGSVYFKRGIERENFDSTGAFQDFAEALLLHLQAYYLQMELGSAYSVRAETYLRNTGFRFVGFCMRQGDFSHFISFWLEIPKGMNICADPLVEPIQSFCLRLRSKAKYLKYRDRIAGQLSRLANLFDSSIAWFSTHAERKKASDAVRELAAYVRPSKTIT